jgi:hypothetical protein
LDIYAETEWDDPDANLDPTEAPPRTGTIVAMIRYHQVGGMGEEILVHDTGIMSYEQSYPVKDSVKTYRRLPPELLRQWLSLVNGLPLDADAPGPDDEYIDPVFLSVETPIDSTGTSKLDAARPTQPYREFMSLVNSWAVALRADRAAMPTGLLAYP